MKILNNETTNTAGIQAFCGIKFRDNPADNDKINEIKNQIKDIITTNNLIDPEVPDTVKENFYKYTLNFKALPLKTISFKTQYRNNYSNPLKDDFNKKKIKSQNLKFFSVPDFNRYVHFFYKLENDLYTRYFDFYNANYRSLKLQGSYSQKLSEESGRHFYNSDNYPDNDEMLTVINYAVEIKGNTIFPFIIHNNIKDIKLPLESTVESTSINNSIRIDTISKIHLGLVTDSFIKSKKANKSGYYYLDLQRNEIKKFNNQLATSPNFRSFIGYDINRSIFDNLSFYFNSNNFISQAILIREDRKNVIDISKCLGKFSFTKRNYPTPFVNENLSVVTLHSEFLEFHISNIQKECLMYFANFYNKINNRIVKGRLTLAIEDFCFLIISCVNRLIQTNDEEQLIKSLSRESIRNYTKSLNELRKTPPIPNKSNLRKFKLKNDKSLSHKANQFSDADYNDLALNLDLISQNSSDIIYFVKKIYNALFYNIDLSSNFSKEEILDTRKQENRTKLNVKLNEVLFDKMSGNFVKTIIE